MEAQVNVISSTIMSENDSAAGQELTPPCRGCASTDEASTSESQCVSSLEANTSNSQREYRASTTEASTSESQRAITCEATTPESPPSQLTPILQTKLNQKGKTRTNLKITIYVDKNSACQV